MTDHHNTTNRDDEWLATLLAEVLDAAEPVPDDAVSAAYAAIELRSINDELSALVFDSLASKDVLAVRGTESDARLLSFVNDHLTLDLELNADGRTIVGQITPAEPGTVEIEVEGGTHTDVPIDAFGRFRVAVDGGPIRFRAIGRLVTPWITR